MAKGVNPMRNVTRVEGPDPSTEATPVSILKDSDFISANGLVTIVPKRAIIFVPEKFSANLKDGDSDKLVSWAEFYVANRSWIEAYEVTRPLAEGNEPISEQNWARFENSKKLVVATLMGGPISVLPLKEAEAEKTGTQQ